MSSRNRYLVADDGALLAVAAGVGAGATGTSPARPTGVRIPGFAASDMPPAVLVDDSGGALAWCATTYRSGKGVTRCGLAPAPAAPPPGLALGNAGGAPLTAPAATATMTATATGSAPAGTAVTTAATTRAAATAGTDGTGSSRTPPAVDHYNLCSAACGPGLRAHSRDVVAWFVERHRPAAVSLNEACYDDGVQLAGRLAALSGGGAGYSALDSAVGCPGAVKRFGNLVLVGAGLEPHHAVWEQFRTQAEGPCDHHTNECRGMVCVDAGPAGQRRAFCSAHLESPRRAPEVASAQVREYLAAVTARFGGHHARVLAGDFNLGRSATDDVLGPAGYRAAAAGPTVGPRAPGAEEIDRIYDDGAGRADATGTTYCDRQASDHCYLTTASPSSTGADPPAA